MKVLLVSGDPATRQIMAVAAAAVQRRTGEPMEFLEAPNGEVGARMAVAHGVALVLADEISSRAGAFALAKDLRGSMEPFPGVIVILLDRPQDAWLARWSGADLWFVKPVDPFALADGVAGLLGVRERT